MNQNITVNEIIQALKLPSDTRLIIGIPTGEGNIAPHPVFYLIAEYEEKEADAESEEFSHWHL